MADVRLDFYDLDADALPDLCMCCGAPAVVRPIKSFSWIPTWARFMPPIIRVWFIKRRRAPIPLCDQHKNHYTTRYIVSFGGLALFLPLLLVGLVLLASDARGPGNVLGLICLAVAGVLFLAWVIAVVALNFTSIVGGEITDHTIHLTNVHPDFVRAYEEQTRGVAQEVEEAARERWGNRRPERGPRKPRRDDYPPDDKVRRR